MSETLTVGSLFSGIGGLDLGLERAGMRVIWQSEIDPYACRVLNKHWPEVPNHGNIKQIKWAEIERPDVLCGGYPCQPFSTVGKRHGEDDPRHLWPWVREAISELRPRYAILENVRGHLSLGGLTVVGELASIGYDAEWRIVSAASVGANHRRDRVIIVAYPTGIVSHKYTDGNTREFSTNEEVPSGHRSFDLFEIGRKALRHDGTAERIAHFWQNQPTMGRVADGVPAGVDRLRGLGNAVVPQVAEVIGRLVVAHAEG